MHWIKKHILKKLSLLESGRYKELIPDGVDGNLFTYHLKQLVADGYVKKDQDGYSLSKKGKTYVATMALSSGNQVKLPRVFAMVYCEDQEGQTLLYKWKRQPYLGHISLPFKRVGYGDSLRQVLAETLKFRTGLEGETEFLGEAEVLVRDGGEVSTHYFAHIYKLEPQNWELKGDNKFGEQFWGKLKDYSGSDLIHGTREIAELVKSRKLPFFKEIVVEKDPS
jgi:ADP-ribose pyrophosphatase YjhB (NUDIX family)